MPVKEAEAGSAAVSDVLAAASTSNSRVIAASPTNTQGWGGAIFSFALRWLPKSVQDRVQGQTSMYGIVKGALLAILPLAGAYWFGQGGDKATFEDEVKLKKKAAAFRTNVGEVDDPSKVAPQPSREATFKKKVTLTDESSLFETNIGRQSGRG